MAALAMAIAVALCLRFWREVFAVLAAGAILLMVFGLAFIIEVMR